MLDAGAQDRLRRHTPTTWLVYTESLTPEEATKWFARLAANDSIFQSLHVPGLTAQDWLDQPARSGLVNQPPFRGRPFSIRVPMPSMRSPKSQLRLRVPQHRHRTSRFGVQQRAAPAQPPPAIQRNTHNAVRA